MTKYTTMDKPKQKIKKVETVFKKIITRCGQIMDTCNEPNEYENVKFLYSDINYGDVFLAWDNSKENDRTIYFGIKGVEFDD